jgi:redox-sensitive bicupin YhaK (pirin superfamily)
MIELRPYDSLGGGHHGWLDTKHHFSFADYNDPNRVHWGDLRVWNDDEIAPQSGFPPHPHANMEIITYVRQGAITHQDSLGNRGRTEAGDVQVMSAGSGIQHSEYNRNKDKKVNFLQIWVFPKVNDIKPRYEQKTFKPEERVNKLQQVVTPVKEESGVLINQDAWFYLGNLKKDFQTDYQVKRKENGVFAFVLEGNATINGQKLNKRDGLGVWDTDKLSIAADSDTEVLLMDVPME